jgi:hypothetical protein
MSVRVVARIRPLLKNEIDKDIIVTAAPASSGTAQLVRIPNPKQPAELYSFQFNSVYEQQTTQQELFDNEGMSLLLNWSFGPMFTPLFSIADRKTPFQGLRCYSLRVWGYGYGKDAYDARWEIIGRSRCHSTIAQRHLSTIEED